jgi:hypothetical protein
MTITTAVTDDHHHEHSTTTTTTSDTLQNRTTALTSSAASSRSPTLTFAIIGSVALLAVIGLVIFQFYHTKKSQADRNKIQMI